MNLLVVDDEPTTRAMLRRALLREFPCNILEATDGLEALNILGAQPVDLIITDVMMPVLSGIELLEAIRSYPPLAPLPVVVMSAERTEETVRRSIQLGIASYLTKPLDAKRVAARLVPLLEQVKRHAAAPRRAASGDGPANLDAAARFLVVDGSADFRHFFASTFGGERPVSESPTGVAAYGDVLKNRPAVVFIGSDIGVLNREMLARKIRADESLRHIKLVAITSRGAQDAGQIADADATVVRTFVPENFKSQIDRIFGPPPPQGGLLNSHPSLRIQAASACEQAFGMMFALEVEASLSEAPAIEAGAFEASQYIEWPEGDERLLFTLYLDEASGKRVATAMLGLPAEDLSPDLVESVAGEISNIVTGRLKTALESAGSAVICTLPQMARAAKSWQAPGPRNSVFVSCLTAERDLTCVITLTSVPVAAPAAPAPAAPAPAPTPAPAPAAEPAAAVAPETVGV